MKNVSNIVKRVLADRLQGVAIDRVLVKPDTDDDGDRVLRITVIINTEADQLNGEQLSGVVRHLRSALTDIDDFPILSYMHRNEAAKLRLEAA